ncbi:AcrR family transcriptional regulator [Arthrobacter stackebrandtii]|uniref:AcrR family transcriptional regulator n=1 Tax=Arthrobacter stackebrandtii TaxID=272161 RepID=A0ABS4YTU7_9MICC|nr:TetR/AcrR family transcriptional regulator [Arthrobacter stackebrandtii]MBP2411822.1 AcrR family transcriptional regulator [Arthrobacter stackebrandtii]PYG99209.1 hypothetical protein CVV67_16800 [Arthrobacter stackebrandtii]
MEAAGTGTKRPRAAAAGRIYSGLQPSERAKERRARLVRAGIEVFGTVGYGAAKIKVLCQQAGLSERYFYESFESREELLTTVYDSLSTGLMQDVVAALSAPASDVHESVRAGMAAVVNYMLVDPRHAQIILVEIVGVSHELESKRHASMTAFAEESRRQLLLLSGIDAAEADARLAANPGDDALAGVLDVARLTAVSMVGGVNNMLIDAVLGGTTANRDRIIEVAYQLISNSAVGLKALAGQTVLAGPAEPDA